MIQRTATPLEVRAQATDINASWQTLLAQAIRDPETLLSRLGLSLEWLPGAVQGHRLFPTVVPEPYLSRIKPGDPHDPLLRQVLPRHEETLSDDEDRNDPLEEAATTVTTGIIRKYQSRALLVLTGTCAVNCRYCFRRHFPYGDNRLSPSAREEALRYLQRESGLNEVILSGGDPLAMNDRLLAEWVRAFEAIPHIKRLRIHTRLPVVIPQRVDERLLTWLRESSLQKVIVLHINHPNEIDQAVADAAARLRDAGATLLNQSVILRGVNDQVDTLCELSERCFGAGIMPYYLHAFDPVLGAAHFRVSDDEARHLCRQMLSRLPGFLVPRLVREVPGGESKWPLDLGLA
ncbi:EF-P beta-lysylation protein EpmB [Mangrovitalea sediminis]|uniref:EF-P beta-lysylation protein EpmB n=1 Tax=Mangrovitalea sediminis TaxID=1982043 RepID=UPI000BE5F661|nr:EF-P beta-lysylation protein EpmB [Mangrovitalea sediminis]